MKALILNGSPKKEGLISSMLERFAFELNAGIEVVNCDVNDFQMSYCKACMKCRPDKECVIRDDARKYGRELLDADILIVGTPTHWANMSAALKNFFDRNVSNLFLESKKGLPIGRHKGKKAVIITSCSTPWPFNRWMGQSSGSIKAVKRILKTAGFSILAEIAIPNTRKKENTSKPGRKMIKLARKVNRHALGRSAKHKYPEVRAVQA
jgi:putative NADPH-quinone reductase